MSKFKVGDRVVDSGFRATGVVVISPLYETDHIVAVRFDNHDYDDEDGWHSMFIANLEPDLTYGSPLREALK